MSAGNAWATDRSLALYYGDSLHPSPAAIPQVAAVQANRRFALKKHEADRRP